MGEHFLNGKVVLHAGNCLDVLAQLEECSIDSVVCDPPYHLTSIVKRFGSETAAPAKVGKTGAYARASVGFMGQQWDGGDIAFRPETWAAVYRVLKPGGYLLAFGGERTQHRVACAIEDAGFEIRSTILWLFGSGFPKSHNVSKGIDRAAGAQGEFGDAKTKAHERYIEKGELRGDRGHEGWQRPWMDDPEAVANAGRQYIPATEVAREWDGWGTALKPAAEFICMARKPLSEKTVAANVLAHGTGAINVDGCRVEAPEGLTSGGAQGHMPQPEDWGSSSRIIRSEPHVQGRWPANVLHDGSEEVVGAFPETSSGTLTPDMNVKPSTGWSGGSYADRVKSSFIGNSGSAARFFFSPKADASDRIGSRHPTVKPVDLMQYLVRLVTKKGGVVLDCFAGTGTTGEAAWREGMRAVLIEADANYQVDIRRRMALCMAGPDERVRESIKARGEPVDYGPLFAARVVAE